MKPKAILPLVAVFAILAALILMKRSQDTPISLVEQAELKPLIAEEVDFASVDRLEMYAGAVSDERVVLTLEDDQWTVASFYNSPSVKGRAKQLLDAIAGLQGEFRATVSGEALADYDLTDERAFHVVGFTGERQEVFHVLTGKSPKYGDMFMRASDSENVYVVNKNIRRDAFLYSLDYDDPPKSDPWLDKQIVAIAGDDFTKVELVMPNKTFVAEKREIPRNETVAPESEEADVVVEPAEPQKEWVVTQGGFNGELHQTPFRDLERYTANLSGFTIVSPEKKSIWGLDNPNYHLTMHRENGEKVELEIARPSFIGPAYIRRLDNNNETLYSIEVNKFRALFAAGGAYYDLPGLLLEEDSMNTMEYTSPDGTVKIAKDGTRWSVTSPASDLPADQDSLNTMERLLSSWQAADYADAATDAGFANAQHTISFSTSEGTNTITLGNESGHTDGRYAKLNEREDTLVMSQKDFKKIFLAPIDLFDTQLTSLNDDDEIVHVEMTRDDASVVFHLGDLAWETTTKDDSFEPKQTAVDALLTAISETEADDITLEAPAISGIVAGTLLVKSDKGSEWSLSFTSTGENTYAVSVNGSTSTYTIGQEAFDALFPVLDTFMPGEEVISFQPPTLTPAPVHDESDGHQH